MPGFSDSQLIAKANVIGSQTEENTISPEMVANLFNDIIANKWNKDSPLPKGDKGGQGDPGPSAYQEWLDLGNSGTEQDFINSLKGEKGDTGDPGPQGIQGEAGPAGPEGPLGPQGNEGLSAYEVWLGQGNTGTEADYLLAIKGDKGDTGDTGPQGIQGIQGDTGPAGPEGPQGIQGETGPEGPQGPAGADGSPDTPTQIVTKLSSITVEEDKIPKTALQGTPYNELQLGIDPETGALIILTDEVPTAGSEKLISSGDIKAFEDANPRGGKLSPGNNTTLGVTPDTKNVSIRRIRGRNGVFYASSSDGTNNRFYSSLDGRFFVDGGTTDSLQYYAMDVAPHGTIIIAGRTGGPTNVKRSTNGGASFNNATITPTLEITGIVHIGAGKWALCARTDDGSGNVAAYSHDDGLNWTMATGADNNAMQDIAAGEGMVFMVSSLETNKFQISTDFGVTYNALPVNPNSFFTQCVYFDGYIVLMRAGTTGSGATYLAISNDAGSSWEGRLVPDDNNQELQGISVIGEWLYMYGNNGYIARTKDLTTKEVLPAVTSNTIVSMSWSMIDGTAVIMAACSNGTNNRILSTV